MQYDCFFERVVVINLRSRPDRLSAFLANVDMADWPFRVPEIVYGVKGSAVPVPACFVAGAGAFGCRQSHISVLQQALTDGVESLLVLEDDAVMCRSFRKVFLEFINELPPNWDGIMLGGEHKDPPIPIKPNIVQCIRTHRTHAYACRKKLMYALFENWLNYDKHIDWRFGELMSTFNVYAPSPFLFAQNEGLSDIAGRTLPRRQWDPPKEGVPVIVLEAPASTALLLMKEDFYFGTTPDARSHIDRGLRRVFYLEADAIITELRAWIYEAQVTCADSLGPHRDKTLVIWNPELRFANLVAAVKQATRSPVKVIRACDISAFLQLRNVKDSEE